MTKLQHVESLLRENIRNLVPYRSARDDFDTGLLLDANENSFGSPVRSSLPLHRYPSPTHDKLREKIADYRGVAMENIFLGAGSDEPIDLLCECFVTRGTIRSLSPRQPMACTEYPPRSMIWRYWRSF